MLVVENKKTKIKKLNPWQDVKENWDHTSPKRPAGQASTAAPSSLLCNMIPILEQDNQEAQCL